MGLRSGRSADRHPLGLYAGRTVPVGPRRCFAAGSVPSARSRNWSAWRRARSGFARSRIPAALHERLIAVKYLLFLGLVAASFWSWDLAMSGAEVEPFKAAIILRFMTEWPMVVYALALIAASVFVERFYCRFMCPLGGGLSIFGRVRMFNWLKRHPECGTRCRICETRLPGRRDQAQRRDRHERMLLLSRLPSHLLRRPRLPADDCSSQAPRRTAADGSQGGWNCTPRLMPMHPSLAHAHAGDPGEGRLAVASRIRRASVCSRAGGSSPFSAPSRGCRSCRRRPTGERCASSSVAGNGARLPLLHSALPPRPRGRRAGGRPMRR